jgi:hypothetical protein
MAEEERAERNPLLVGVRKERSQAGAAQEVRGEEQEQAGCVRPLLWELTDIFISWHRNSLSQGPHTLPPDLSAESYPSGNTKKSS